MMLKDYYVRFVTLLSSKPYTYDLIHRILLFGLPYKRVSEIANVAPDESILDVACGPAKILNHISSFAFYTGIDSNNKHLDYAEASYRSDKTRFVKGDIVKDLDALGSETFDVTLMLGILHHLTDNELSETLRLLSQKTSSRLITFDPVYTSWHWVANLLGFLDQGRFVRTSHQYHSLVSKHFYVRRRFIVLPRSLAHCFLVLVLEPKFD